MALPNYLTDEQLKLAQKNRGTLIGPGTPPGSQPAMPLPGQPTGPGQSGGMGDFMRREAELNTPETRAAAEAAYQGNKYKAAMPLPGQPAQQPGQMNEPANAGMSLAQQRAAQAGNVGTPATPGLAPTGTYAQQGMSQHEQQADDWTAQMDRYQQTGGQVPTLPNFAVADPQAGNAGYGADYVKSLQDYQGGLQAAQTQQQQDLYARLLKEDPAKAEQYATTGYYGPTTGPAYESYQGNPQAYQQPSLSARPLEQPLPISGQAQVDQGQARLAAQQAAAAKAGVGTASEPAQSGALGPKEANAQAMAQRRATAQALADAAKAKEAGRSVQFTSGVGTPGEKVSAGNMQATIPQPLQTLPTTSGGTIQLGTGATLTPAQQAATTSVAASAGTGATGVSGALGSSELAQQLWEQLQSSTEEAKAANETRYADILAQLEGVGTQQGADIDEAAKNRQADLMQQMVSGGLAGTSVPMAGGALIERERSAEQRRLAEDVALMKTGVMERRSDVSPDTAMYADLLKQLGYSQGEGGTSAATGAEGATGGAAEGAASKNYVPGSGAVTSVLPGTVAGSGTAESYAGLTASQAGALERELADLQAQHAATIRALKGQTQGSTKSRLENQLTTLEGQINSAQGKLSAYNQAKTSAASEAQAKAEWDEATGGLMPYPGGSMAMPAGVGPTYKAGGQQGQGTRLPTDIMDQIQAELNKITTERPMTTADKQRADDLEKQLRAYQQALELSEAKANLEQQPAIGASHTVFDPATKGMVREIWDGTKWVRETEIGSNIQNALASFLQ